MPTVKKRTNLRRRRTMRGGDLPSDFGTYPYGQVLQFIETANETDKKAAYRQASKRFHPDRQGGNKELFQGLSAVYEGEKTVAQVLEETGQPASAPKPTPTRVPSESQKQRAERFKKQRDERIAQEMKQKEEEQRRAQRQYVPYRADVSSASSFSTGYIPESERRRQQEQIDRERALRQRQQEQNRRADEELEAGIASQLAYTRQEAADARQRQAILQRRNERYQEEQEGKGRKRTRHRSRKH